jgi:tyrosine-protein phosphatase OCA6
MEFDNCLTPPYRYGVVIPGFHRGAYPTLRNYRFLNRLSLTTIISVLPEPPSKDIIEYCNIAKVKHASFVVNRDAFLNTSLSSQFVLVFLCLITNSVEEGSSIYLHCLDGRRITALLVLILRKLQNWTPGASFSEYWAYQTVLRNPLTPTEIERNSREIIRFVLETASMIESAIVTQNVIIAR